MEGVFQGGCVKMRSHTRLPPPKEAAVSKTLGIILITLGLFGLAWGGFTYTTSERSSTSDRFTRLATRHITCRCLPSQAQCCWLVASCCW